MKIARFIVNSKEKVGVLEESHLKELEGNLFEEWNYTGEKHALEDVTLLAPLKPNQIIGIGANYVAQVEDRPKNLPDIPVFFFKPTSSVVGPEEKVILPKHTDGVKFESELAIIIGKKAKDIDASEVYDYVFGFTVANDITSPDYFHESGHWTIGKSFDTFTPLGPFIETNLDPTKSRIRARVDGVEKQNSGTDLMIVPIREMIAYLSTVMTLMPGDVILTGSPLGAEMVGEKNVIECEIEEIGILRNSIASLK